MIAFFFDEKGIIEIYFEVYYEKLFVIGEKTKNPGFFRKVYDYIRNFGPHCVATYLLGQYTRKLDGISKFLCFPILISYRFMESQIQFFHHVSIGRDTVIGPGFYIGYEGSCTNGKGGCTSETENLKNSK